MRGGVEEFVFGRDAFENERQSPVSSPHISNLKTSLKADKLVNCDGTSMKTLVRFLDAVFKN